VVYLKEICLYRWIGPVFKTQLSTLPAVVMTELEQEFDKIQGTKAVPTRYLRSQQEKQAAVAQATADNEENEDGKRKLSNIRSYKILI
jgi:cytoskeleton-associated protein 5